MDSITLQELPICSVEELKNKVSKRCGILPKQFDLLYKSKVLEESILLEDIIEKKTNLEMLFNESRIIFRLYLHKTLPNRTDTELNERFIHVKVDNLDDQIGEITSSFAEKLKLEEDELHLVHKGYYVEKHRSYKDEDVMDRSILCLCHCKNSIKDTGSKTGTIETILQATTTGSVEKVTEPSMERLQIMQIQFRKLKLQQSKKEPKFKIISRGAHNRKIFSRMVSVPLNFSRSSHGVDGLSGYKSDTDLLRQKQAAKTSSSDSQLDFRYNFTNNEEQQIRSTGPNNGSYVKTSTPLFNQGPNNRPLLNLDIRSTSPLPDHDRSYLCVTPPSSSNNLSALSDTRGNNLAGNNPWNKLFLQVSHEKISDWENVGRHLEIGESNISVIDQNHQDVKEKAYSMLTKWQEFKGSNATKENLIKALEDCELKRVAEIVEEFDITPYVQDLQDVTDLETDRVDDSSGLEFEMCD
ncbi:unnamed protein product [Mytilus coruscus]|uniref:Death domain-containing protein n=1 Tax=Mytilus coruscus TaxID=42192 RepID=A0A6J8BRT7_MYTCO|nr:unnamed protein product [Mytilus coruscus]